MVEAEGDGVKIIHPPSSLEDMVHIWRCFTSSFFEANNASEFLKLSVPFLDFHQSSAGLYFSLS